MRNKEKNDYLILPFPRIDGKPHPALEELKRQATLLSLMPYGLDRGAGPYGAALLIDRDMRLRPHEYPSLPSAGLWFPANATLIERGRETGAVTTPQASSPALKTDEDRKKDAAKNVAKKWQRDEDE